MWSKAPVKSTKVLNKRIGLSFKMHLLLTWILMYFRLPLPKLHLTEAICPWFLDQRLSTIIYPMDKNSSPFMTTTCSSTAMAKVHDVHPSLAGSDRSGMSSPQSTRFSHAVKRSSQFRQGWRALSLDGQIRLNIFGFFVGEEFVEPESEETQREVRTSAVLVPIGVNFRWTFSLGCIKSILGCIKSIYIYIICLLKKILIHVDLWPKKSGEESYRVWLSGKFQSWCFNNQVLSNNGDKRNISWGQNLKDLQS